MMNGDSVLAAQSAACLCQERPLSGGAKNANCFQRKQQDCHGTMCCRPNGDHGCDGKDFDINVSSGKKQMSMPRHFVDGVHVVLAESSDNSDGMGEAVENALFEPFPTDSIGDSYGDTISLVPLSENSEEEEVTQCCTREKYCSHETKRFKKSTQEEISNLTPGDTNVVETTSAFSDVFLGTPCSECIPRSITGTGRPRKLVLHFDVRNTILVADSVTQIGVEQALNSYLTGVTWGEMDTISGTWRWLCDQPMLTAPQQGAITYYKSLERQFVRTPSDHAALRRYTGNFTDVEIGERFRGYFNKHLQLLEWTSADDDHPLDSKLTMTGDSGKQYHYILPSFVKLLYSLHAAGRHFSVIIRTYGMDAPNVLTAIEHIISGNHPLFSSGAPLGGALPIPVELTPGHITRYDDGRIHCEQHRTLSSPSTYVTDHDIYDMLNTSTGVSGFVDDFFHWQRNNYNHLCGKPMWIDMNDDRVHHIFFDDNIRVTDTDSIVDVRVFDSTSKTGEDIGVRSLQLGEIASLENVCLVQADLLESTENIDYFVDKVRLCEDNYYKSRLFRLTSNHSCQVDDVTGNAKSCNLRE